MNRTIPWAQPWRRRCPGIAVDPFYGPVRCDLRRTHPGHSHRAEHGMYDLVWDDTILLMERH